MSRTAAPLALLLAGLLANSSCRPTPASAEARPAATSSAVAVEPALSHQALDLPPPPPPLSPDEVPPVDLVSRPLGALAPFYDALDGLRRGRQAPQPLRVLWMGDSHTSADFMTHRIRLRLQSLTKDAGPGFLRLGLEAYRHEAASFEVSGKWRHEPLLPAQRTRVKDGVFGYGGIRTLPQAGARVRVTVRPSGTSTEASGAHGEALDAIPLRFRISYRLPPGAAIDVHVGEEQLSLASGDSTLHAGGAIASAVIHGTMADGFELSHAAGAPEVFGVFAERAEAGVVLDTVGIDGARAATPLAWEPDQFARAVAERAPALLVLAYGTNEAFDKGSVEQYTEHVAALIRLVRKGAGPIPCWVIGPMDASGPMGTSRARVLEVNAAEHAAALQEGCAFTSAQELMGGEGSFARWTVERPQLARTDGIHLTIAGYRKLGDLLADALAPLPPEPR